MKPYRGQRRFEIIIFFYSCQRSIVMARYFNLRAAPTCFMIGSLVDRLMAERPERRRQRNIHTEFNVDTV